MDHDEKSWNRCFGQRLLDRTSADDGFYIRGLHMRPPRIPIPGIHKAGLQRRRDLYTSGNSFLIPDWIAGLSDLYDAHWEWCGYNIRGCGMGPGRINEGPSRLVSADGQGLPEGAADDPYLRGGREDSLMGSVFPQ